MRPGDYIVVGLILLLFSSFKLRAVLRARKERAASRTATRAAGRAARTILEKKGYRVLAVNEKVSYQAVAGGRLYQGCLQADLTVAEEKGKTRYSVLVVADGEEASQYLRAEGRVKLLPLQLLHGTGGVLLVDLENEKIHPVSFKTRATAGQKELYLLVLLAGFAVGAAAMALLTYIRGD
ncbi:MAG: hypothetical protein K6T80_07030 [Firmicutes bacterium]|nr:hypothetical protein [Bacillota bacterium]